MKIFMQLRLKNYTYEKELENKNNYNISHNKKLTSKNIKKSKKDTTV